MQNLRLMLVLVLVGGCGRGDTPQLAPARGTVKMNGAPVAKATVSFLPPQGPPGQGDTDAAGNFTVSTNGQSGAVVGPCKVIISAMRWVGKDSTPVESTPEAAAEFSRKVNAGEVRLESAVPEIYGKSDTTPLKVEVQKDASKNNFTFDLDDKS